ncbi:hypothetical protein N7532_011408 [Penicillium argentinense]|uniref:Uncharacterized protein n=1 Tax=Penicillium argentinense TaxID=1131581 RepID=A0A9W9JUX9_9EURO|nr:uncharacterized protein N7532_011408 [Penicillium argentinense]KAJ5082365.1 hypothetical protein N7532_011408 [Penicillium argentinense]
MEQDQACPGKLGHQVPNRGSILSGHALRQFESSVDIGPYWADKRHYGIPEHSLLVASTECPHGALAAARMQPPRKMAMRNGAKLPVGRMKTATT